jgi:UDP-N-acetylglucosamine diphosphorylase/glucosamine-1-phosphate N-acetyltransferase
MRLIVFEDDGVVQLGPLAQTRPVFELRCGALALIDRQQRCFEADELAAFVRPEMANLARFLRPSLIVNEMSSLAAEDIILVNARWLAPIVPPVDGSCPCVGLVGDQIAFVVPGVRLSEEELAELAWKRNGFSEDLPIVAAGGAMMDWPWDLVEHNSRALIDDGHHWQTHRATADWKGLTILGPSEQVLIDPTASIEPMTLIDARKGPVLLDRGVIVQAFSRLEGPCYIGPETHVLAGRIKGSSIGPACRIGGEVEASIVQGYSNKAHEGFLGHSYLGEWVNFGAGTQTSDLRNDYGKVDVTIAGHRVETGLLKVGAFIGDHTKTSINTLFNTGSVAGPFGMFVTSGSLLPRNLPAFCQVSHGRVTARTDMAAMFATATTMMARRGVSWTEAHADFFLDLYERTQNERFDLVQNNEQRRRKLSSSS